MTINLAFIWNFSIRWAADNQSVCSKMNRSRLENNGTDDVFIALASSQESINLMLDFLPVTVSAICHSLHLPTQYVPGTFDTFLHDIWSEM